MAAAPWKGVGPGEPQVGQSVQPTGGAEVSALRRPLRARDKAGETRRRPNGAGGCRVATQVLASPIGGGAYDGLPPCLLPVMELVHPLRCRRVATCTFHSSRGQTRFGQENGKRAMLCSPRRPDLPGKSLPAAASDRSENPWLRSIPEKQQLSILLKQKSKLSASSGAWIKHHAVPRAELQECCLVAFTTQVNCHECGQVTRVSARIRQVTTGLTSAIGQWPDQSLFLARLG